jgi:gliding motility-associated-like protein
VKHTDDTFNEQLRKTLNNYESQVPDALWQNVAAQLPQVKAASSGFSVAKIAALVITGAAIGALVIFMSKPNTNASQTNSTPSATDIQTDTSKFASVDQITIPTVDATATPVVSDSMNVNELVSNEGPANPPSPAVMNAAPQTPTTVVRDIEPVYAEEEPILPSEPAHNTMKSDARFSVVEIDKTGLAYFFIPQQTSATNYAWSFGDGETSTELSPQHSYEEPGEYPVELTLTDNGVQRVFRQTVTAIPAGVLEVPTIFTPNADGKNDTFDVMALSRFVTVEFIRIFNTAGLIVFESNGNAPWNGEDNHGNPLPDGNYFYTLKAKDLRQQPVEKSGTVYLRR